MVKGSFVVNYQLQISDNHEAAEGKSDFRSSDNTFIFPHFHSFKKLFFFYSIIQKNRQRNHSIIEFLIKTAKFRPSELINFQNLRA